jgi:hypothetical protein
MASAACNGKRFLLAGHINAQACEFAQLSDCVWLHFKERSALQELPLIWSFYLFDWSLNVTDLNTLHSFQNKLMKQHTFKYLSALVVQVFFWLRHCATSRMVAGSIPDGAIGIFHWHKPSSRTMALESTQPITEMSTRNISWRVKAAGAMADNLTTFMCRLSWNLGVSTSWNPQGPSRPLQGLLYLFFFT